MTFLDFHRNFPVEAACIYVSAGFILATVIACTIGLRITNYLKNDK